MIKTKKQYCPWKDEGAVNRDIRQKQRLSKAAPALLKVCEQIETVCPGGDFGDDTLIEIVISGKELKELRKAIAAAKA